MFANAHCNSVKYGFCCDGLLQNGELLVSTDHVTADSDAGIVEFIKAYKSDEGNYTCIAVNDAGNHSHTAHLVVRGMLSVYCCLPSTRVRKNARVQSIILMVVRLFSIIFFTVKHMPNVLLVARITSHQISKNNSATLSVKHMP